VLTTLQLIVTPSKVTLQTTENSINQVIMLKQFVNSVNPVFEALTGTASTMLNNIREVRVHPPSMFVSFH
jgi:DNA mismatch repair protein MSH4